MKIKYIFLFSFFSFTTYAQINLVPNHSFEGYIDCPTDQHQLILAYPWINPTAFLSEYFNFCGSSLVSVPVNAGGDEAAIDGKAYVGFYAFYDTSNSSEYIQVRLNDTMQGNHTYYIEFFLSLADNSGLATKNIGAYISDTAIGNNYYSSLYYTPQIVSTTLAQVSQKNGWSKISGTYMAHGGENYITIGKFYPNPSTDAIPVSGGQWPCCSYYFLDAVYVGLDSTVSLNEDQKDFFNFTVYPNPSKDILNVEYNFNESAEIFIYNVRAVLCKTVLLKNKSQQIDISGFPQGVYFLKLKSERTTLVRKIIKD